MNFENIKKLACKLSNITNLVKIFLDNSSSKSHDIRLRNEKSFKDFPIIFFYHNYDIKKMKFDFAYFNLKKDFETYIKINIIKKKGNKVTKL